jgi:hypothetical protein
MTLLGQFGWLFLIPTLVLQPPRPLPQAHAHNDYEHERPLLDALDRGFCGVEADIFLAKGELLVAHNFIDVRPERTLEALYLKPLAERIHKNGGKVYPDGPTLTLLIDLKSAGEPTYAALHEVLAKYADILSSTEHGKHTRRAISVVISGNRPESLKTQSVRYAGLDGRLSDLDSSLPADVMPMISDNWRLHFKWNGKGPMPDAEKAKLDEVVAKAHEAGRVVRFWATPENPAVWQVLKAAGVDLINTDRLDELQAFLSDQPGS